MTLTRMETTVADALRSAAAIAVYQEADRTQIIHLMLGLLIYSEQNQAFLRSRKVSKKPFESWHQKLREPMLILEECTPEPSPELQNLLTRYVLEGRSRGLLTEHNLMLHLLRDPDKRIDTYLKALKLDRQEFVTHLMKTQEEKADQDAEAPKQAFSDYVEDMNAKARAGEIHPIQGRQNDMQWLLNTLCQYKKRNAILIGPPGVGKTALIEELALRIEEGTVPDQLKGKTVYALDAGAMVAGTKLRGQFEERMRNLTRFLKQNRNIILFIDEIHAIMSAGNTRGSSLNASNMLKPALSRGEITCIGATTPDDVGPLENDPAFKRRFQFRWLDALANGETLEVLRAEAKRLEQHYGITYTIGGIKRILDAANDYYPHQFNPDKSLTLADAVGSYTKNRLGQSVVNTKAVNASLRARDFKESAQVTTEIDQWLTKMFECRQTTSDILLALSAYLLQLRMPGVLVLTSEQDWLVREITNYLSRQLFNQDPILLDGEELTEPDAITQLKGVPSVYLKEPTLLDELRYSPHRVVYIRCLEKSSLAFQQMLSRAIVVGELLESNSRKLQLRHSFFVISCASPKRTLGFGEAASKPNLPPELLKKATIVSLPEPKPSWVEDYLVTKMQLMADRVRSKIKVAFSSDTPAYIRQKMQEAGEDAALRLVESAILKASQQQAKRLVISPEIFKDTFPFYTERQKQLRM
jgi:ATP-dependent Clp protease ATP-binding subunit ClpA